MQPDKEEHVATPEQLPEAPLTVDAALVMVDLTVADVHNVCRPSLHQAKSRSSFAPPNAAGNDFHDGTVEGLGQILSRLKWRRGSTPETSHRLIRADSRVHVSLSSATGLDSGRPKAHIRTNNKKGAGVRATIDARPRHTPLDLAEFAEEPSMLTEVLHLYLLHEITELGVKLAIARPAHMTGVAGEKGFIDDWTWLKHIPFLGFEDDLSAFDSPDEGPDFLVDVRRKRS